MDKRLENEIAHGRLLQSEGAGEIWNWTTPAGKKRWARRVRMLTGHLDSSMHVLELGCGAGFFTREIARSGCSLTAIDISPELIAMAEADVRGKNVRFQIDNAYGMSFDDKTFDTVVGSSVLHHLEIDKAISEIYRILKPGGTLFFTEPNMLNPQIAIQKNIPFIKRKLGDSPDETAFFKWQMKKLLSRSGFTAVNAVPFDFLHPSIPSILLKTLEPFCNMLETIPVVREFAGSLYIFAQKPAD